MVAIASCEFITLNIQRFVTFVKMGIFNWCYHHLILFYIYENELIRCKHAIGLIIFRPAINMPLELIYMYICVR